MSTFRPSALIGTPNTPGFVAAMFGVIDPVMPARYKSSDINTLAAAMVLDAEGRLLLSGAADGGKCVAVWYYRT